VQSGLLLHQGHLEGRAEWSVFTLGPLGRLQSGLLLHYGHLEGHLEQPLVALGPLGRLFRATFCCTRVTWKAANAVLDATKL